VIEFFKSAVALGRSLYTSEATTVASGDMKNDSYLRQERSGKNVHSRLSHHASILSLNKARHFIRCPDDIVFDVKSSN
jgi:hypothetical protein